MKLIFAQPTYGPTDPQVNASCRSAIMHAAKFGHEWVGDCAPDRMPYAVSRNKVVEAVVNEDAYADAAIFWCDSDILQSR